jgi:hypothetical protein
VRRPARAAAAALLLTLVAACGGGAGDTPMTPATPLPTGPNVAALLVDAGPKQLGVNLPSVTVTICIPGTTTCQTIDHVLVDTGSTGLRIAAEALNTAMLGMPLAATAAGDPMYECLTYASSAYSWGSVRQADVQIANGKASNIAIHLIGDPAIQNAPADCSGDLSTNPPTPLSPQNTVADLGGNGLIGINVFLEDCGPACVTIANPDNRGFYYGCPQTGCVGTTVALASQIHNPIAELGSDNNGVELVVPAITAVGAATVAGALVLGVDTQSNNQLGGAAVISVDPLSGNFTTVYNGQTYTRAGFVDSGSNGLFFTDSSLAACTVNVNWYCPPTAVTLSATNQGAGASSGSSTVSFNIASFDALSNANPSFTSYDNIGGPMPPGVAGFDWGMPFFFGRTVAVAFEGKTTSAGAGPFIAYADF